MQLGFVNENGGIDIDLPFGGNVEKGSGPNRRLFYSFTHNPTTMYVYAIRNFLAAVGLSAARQMGHPECNHLSGYHPLNEE